MAITASALRQDIYRILDSVLDSGQPVEVERRGRRLKIAPVVPASKLSRLVPRTTFLLVGAMRRHSGDPAANPKRSRHRWWSPPLSRGEVPRPDSSASLGAAE